MVLHVVAFDIPYPANYGGVIVIFHQIRALHALGVKVILHCFQYGGRTPQDELARYCHEVYYYRRSRSLLHQMSLIPFIMQSRRSRALLRRLRQDKHPILFEGMHTTGFIWSRALKGRQKIVRMHNVEWQYYERLSELATRLPQKLFYFIESIKLQRVEPWVVLYADEILTLSTRDQAYYAAQKANTHYLPAFHPNDRVECAPGKGEYVLFHGKLSVPDNEKAALWLIREVFAGMNIPFIIAGMEPTEEIRDLVAQYDHIELVENPDEQRMHTLIRNAHINLLVSFTDAGIKLKLLNALFRGRFCIVNDAMVSGTRLHELCYVRNSPAAMRQTVEALINTHFTEETIEQRRQLLEHEFSNLENARKLVSILRWAPETATY